MVSGARLLGVTILLAAVAALQPVPPGAVMHASTTRSLDQFGSCFVRTQEAAGRAWSFVPSVNGGMFSNAGAQGIGTPYLLKFVEGEGANHVRLFAASSRAGIAAAIERCR
jgi:hypothetical protein